MEGIDDLDLIVFVRGKKFGDVAFEELDILLSEDRVDIGFEDVFAVGLRNGKRDVRFC